MESQEERLVRNAEELLQKAALENARLRDALIGMVEQHCPIRDGEYSDECLSANEFALEVLGPDFKPDRFALCDYPGCGNGWTAFIPEAGERARMCSDHFRDYSQRGRENG